MFKNALGVTTVFLALVCSSATAKQILDLTPDTPTSLSGTAAIGDTFLVTNEETKPAGTGNFNSFVRIEMKGQEKGFNTDALPQYDEKSGVWTHSVKVGKLGTQTINSVEYIAFLLDVNQAGGDKDLISLNQVQIFLSSADLGGPGVTNTLTEATNDPGGNDALISFTGGSATEIFRMNNPQNTSGGLSTNTEVQIGTGTGSGSGDMFLYVQSSLFGSDLNKYVTLFSQFGRASGTYESNSGFEEWAFREGSGPTFGVTAVAPEPSTILAALTGLVPLGLLARRRRRSETPVA